MPRLPFNEQTLQVELIALRGDVVRLQQTSDRFAAMAHEAAEAAGRIADEIRALEDLAGMKPSQRFALVDDRLRGKAISVAALEALRRRADPYEPIHYREWFDLLAQDGHRISGRDPLATFLTQISRIGEVERVDGSKGVYRLSAEVRVPFFERPSPN